MNYKFFDTETEYDEWFKTNFKALVLRVDHTDHGILISYIEDKVCLKNKKKK